MGINNDNSTPDPSAMLEIKADNKGILVPRLTLAQRNAIAAPANSLLIYQTDNDAGFWYYDLPNAIWRKVGDENWRLTGNANTNPTNNFLGTTDNQALAFRTNGAERMRILSNGNVGINAASASERLQVGGNVRVGLVNPPFSGTYPNFGSFLYFSGGLSGSAFDSDNSDPIYLVRYNASADQTQLRLNLSDECGTNDSFVIQSGGSGSCGANTPFFVFNISGGTAQAFKPGGGAWAVLSDERLKKNVASFEDGLNILKNISPVWFEYNGLSKTPDTGKKHVGVIAQDLQKIAPYMVEKAYGEGDYLAVDPSAITYITINAVQEQQIIIEKQQSQIDAQQKQIDELIKRLEKLEKK